MHRSFDAVVIGAGVSGLYALHKLRELGLSSRVFEAGSGVGGTWYWNRYPGARFDSESYSYQYSFSRELIDEWNWSEHFAGQPEIERYLNYVADKFDLKRDIEFNSRIKSVVFNDTERLWDIHTESGTHVRARYVLAATGFMSAYQFPAIEGIDTFTGISAHTARWPQSGIDFRGKRVGIIGSGATAVQVIQTIAPDVAHLSVFQRTPNWCTPLRNAPIDDQAQKDLKERAEEIFAHCKQTFAGFIHDADSRAGGEVTRAERFEQYETLFERGGFALWLANYKDLFTNREIADEVGQFLAEKVRARVVNAQTAEKLIPKDHLFGTKRPPGEKNYYEVFNLPHVELVDLRESPIVRVTPAGIETHGPTANQLHELDVIIYATGFRSVTGELMRMDIVGENQQSLQEKWANGPKTNLGVQFAGFPNFFSILGPHNPAAFCNITRCVETNVEWIAECIRYIRDSGFSTMQAKADAEAVWTQRCYDSVKGMLIDEVRDSWFFGYHNQDADRGQFLMFTEGVPAYRKIFADVAAGGYPGFEFR